MDAREKIIDKRTKFGITLKQVAKRIGVSEALLSMVEAGHVTHPKIARKIGQYYKLTELETEELMPKCRRPHDPAYDPTLEEPQHGELERPIPVKKDIVDTYIAEHQDRLARQHQKRGQYL